jgi:general secretion pathway protein K
MSGGGATPTGGAAPAPGAPAMGGGGGGLNIRLWEIVPVDCSLFGMLLGAAESSGGMDEPPPPPDRPEFGEEDLASGKAFSKSRPQSFGDFSGCFHAEISDEEQKINVNRLNLGALTGMGPMMQALSLFADPKFEFLYEKSDANNVKMTPQEVLIALHDWVDERDTQASLNLTGTGDPFPDGFGDENHNYMSRYTHRYRAKNALFDSLDELYQVDGVSDLFMAAFRDRLTVYPDFNRKLNINTNDPVQQVVDIYSVAANPNDPKLRNPAVIQSILQEINLTRMMMPFIGMSASTYAGIVERAGIAIRPEIKTNAANNNFITDKSETFTIKATGQAGKVEKNITAVVRYNEGLGKLLYYRIE